MDCVAKVARSFWSKSPIKSRLVQPGQSAGMGPVEEDGGGGEGEEERGGGEGEEEGGGGSGGGEGGLGVGSESMSTFEKPLKHGQYGS